MGLFGEMLVGGKPLSLEISEGWPWQHHQQTWGILGLGCAGSELQRGWFMVGCEGEGLETCWWCVIELRTMSQDRRVDFSWWLCLGMAIKQNSLLLLFIFSRANFSEAGKLLSKAGPWGMWAAGLKLAHKMALSREEEMGVKSRVVSLVNQ